MKLNANPAVLKNRALLFMMIVLISLEARSQAPIYRFRNPTLSSGTAGQVNAVYRFPHINPSGTNIDALVKIQNKVGNITLQNIDRTADGYDEAFQPEYKVGSLTNAYFEFRITFVLAGTNTPTSLPVVDVSGLDIDGSTSGLLTLKEFNRIDLGGGTCTFNTMNSQLTLSNIGTAFEGDNYTGALFGALVDTAAKEVMFSVSNTTVSSITYRAGANTILSSSSTRYASLYFKKFDYPQGAVLSIFNLAAFSGVADGDKAQLKWTLTGGNTVNDMILEKSNSGQSFTSIAEFWTNIDGNTQKDFSYADNKGEGEPVFYRLKITSNEGKVQYSNILHFQGQEKTTNNMTIYPSSVQSTATVNYNSKGKQNAVIYVTDLNGRTIKQQDVVLQQGTNSIQVSGFDQFPKGNYIVSVSTAQQRSAKQIVVQ